MSNFIKNLKAIKQGWGNYVFVSPTIENIALERAKTCAECPNIQTKKFLTAVLGDPIKEVEGKTCGLCGCPLSAMTRQLTKQCPDPVKPRW